MLKLINYNNCKDILIFSILFYLLLKLFKINKEHMTNSTDPNLDMETITNLSSFIKQNSDKLNVLDNFNSNLYNLTFNKIKSNNNLCIDNTCINASQFANIKDTYTKSQADSRYANIDNVYDKTYIDSNFYKIPEYNSFQNWDEWNASWDNASWDGIP